MDAMPLVAALFETRARAEEALAALIGAGIAQDRVEIVGGGAGGDAAYDGLGGGGGGRR
jgi:hypothetical protein